MKRKLKKSVVYVLYGLTFALMLGGLFLIGKSDNSHKLSVEDENLKYVSKDIINQNNDIPVNTIENEKIVIKKPFNDLDVMIVQSYYDMNDNEDIQQNSLIFYENTYIPSSGISYSKEGKFDVVAILDGKVIDVKQDDILGNVIKVEHSNGIISVYQSIDNIRIKKDDSIKQGDVLATSSSSNISSNLGNHLYFELIVNGQNVNPEKYYGKSIDEI